MSYETRPIRPFIGARDYELSRSFYRVLGFEERVVSPNMCQFQLEGIGFYLQNSYIKDWIDNTMIFVEVESVEQYWNKLLALNLKSHYKEAKLTPIKS